MFIAENEIITDNVFETVIANFPDIIHSVDSAGNIVFTNQAASNLLGYTQEELLSMNVRELYAEEILKELEKGFSKLKDTGDTFVESVLKSKTGEKIPVEIRSFAIYDDQNIFVRTFSIIRDITKFKELKEGLIHAERLAAIGELTSGIAHDINNPLTLIRGCCELMDGICKEDETDATARLSEMEEYVGDIDRASRSIAKLSRSMLNFSRNAAEDPTTIDLYTPISDGIFLVSSKLKTANIKVNNQVEPGLYLVEGMENKLQQIFANLVSNACDAMEGGQTRNLDIKIVSVERDGTPFWQIDFSDTGKGISSEKHELLFSSFYTTKPKGKGTGLGLSIARGVARDHKGDVKVRSVVDKGTTFSVLIPQSIQ